MLNQTYFSMQQQQRQQTKAIIFHRDLWAHAAAGCFCVMLMPLDTRSARLGAGDKVAGRSGAISAVISIRYIGQRCMGARETIARDRLGAAGEFSLPKRRVIGRN
jgi:hypothetical protein